MRGAMQPSTASPMPRLRYPRKSVFKELDVDTIFNEEEYQARVPPLQMNYRRPCELQHCDFDSSGASQSNDSPSSSYSEDTLFGVSSASSRWILPSRLYVLAFALVLIIPLIYDTPLLCKAGPSMFGANAGVVKRSEIKKALTAGNLVVPRADSPTNVCNRWSQQSALVNGTVYIYGGHATTEQGQTSNTWNNDFLTLDLTASWDISSPSIKALPQPSGPPSVSNGYLWNSFDSLYLYGGEFSDTPDVEPVPFSLWEYNLSNSSWIEHQNPTTSAGNNSDPAEQPVQRAAEGAGISVPGLGRGWYFAGHLDEHTTPGWSNSVYRLYLKSLLEFTFPGYTNNGVQSLSSGQTAGPDGVWRNITQGGIQDSAQFPGRADSVLVYVPGYGPQGILVSMGGGTNISFTQMNIIDVFDIATSTWYKQSTSGNYPILRVNPCAVAASAPDGSSTNIYMYGGQNLIPYLNQTQYGDMWILTIPSFTWIQVDTSGQSVPPARVGHTCSLWDGQMVVVGGYNTDLAGGCDNGFYVFSVTNLTWQNNFVSLSGSNAKNNTQNDQQVQISDPLALSGSYGYEVPAAVQQVIGGKGYGGATVTAPVESATAGPLATGKPITYTLTGASGATVTETGSAVPGAPSSGNGKSGPNIAAIVAGVVAGCFAILAGYLGFCAWIYRRQLKLYKNHVAMAQRAAIAGGPGEKSTFLTQSSTKGSSTARGKSSEGSSAVAGSSGYGPVPPVPPLLGGPPVGGNSTANSSAEDLLGEPTFVGVLLNPRRSLRVVNRD